MFGFRTNVKKLKERGDIKGLVKALGHKDVSIKIDAANALGEIGDSSAADALLDAMKDKNTDVRKAAVRALAKIADDRSIAAIVKALRDDSVDVRLEAAKAIAEIGQKKAKKMAGTISESLNIPANVAEKMLKENKLLDAAKVKFVGFLRK